MSDFFELWYEDNHRRHTRSIKNKKISIRNYPKQLFIAGGFITGGADLDKTLKIVYSISDLIQKS